MNNSCQTLNIYYVNRTAFRLTGYTAAIPQNHSIPLHINTSKVIYLLFWGERAHADREGLAKERSEIKITELTVGLDILFICGNSRSVIKENETLSLRTYLSKTCSFLFLLHLFL